MPHHMSNSQQLGICCGPRELRPVLCDHREGWGVVGGRREGLCISVVRNTADPQITDSVHCFSLSQFPYDLNKRINSLEKGLYL